MDWMRALATGLVIAAIYVVVEKSGMLEGKSLGREPLILLPLYFVGILVLDVLWPVS